ncbi:MAG: Ldh family oxidoreductase [Acidimicrobiia bacterium]
MRGSVVKAVTRTYDPDRLVDLVSAVFEAAGASLPTARTVAGLLVSAERMGHPSHGVLRVPDYVARVDAGKLDPAAEPVVVREMATSALVDARWGFGQLGAMAATDWAVDHAGSGVAVAGAHNLNHIGRLGDFTEAAARHGMVAIAMVGGTPSGATGNVAPHGGREPIWGTNPIAIAIPGLDRIFSLDFATSVIAGGKAKAALARGEMLDDQYLIDTYGRPTNDPSAIDAGGAIRPFGGHKGYGLAFAIELLAGALVGTTAPDLAYGSMHNGYLVIVIDPATFGDAGRFGSAVEELIDRVKATAPASGFEEVMYPGEPEQRRMAAATGVEVPESVIETLNGLATRFGLQSDW